MKKSKYLGKQFGNWTCTHVGVSWVAPAFYVGTRARQKRPGHRSYYYIMERLTSDGKAEKMIRLNCNEAAKVWKKMITVEEILDKRESKKAYEFVDKVSYHFI